MTTRTFLKVLKVTSAGAVCLALGTGNIAQAATIDFDNGTAGNSIGSFYADQGVTFSNATWQNFGPLAGVSPPLALASGNSEFPGVFSRLTPIVGVFSSAQTLLSIVGADIGAAGIRIDAYDAVVGGNLVGFDQFIGIKRGTGIFSTLSVEAASIRRFELYQVSDGFASGDGVALDNLTFQATPVPTPALLPGLIGLGISALRKRREAAEQANNA